MKRILTGLFYLVIVACCTKKRQLPVSVTTSTATILPMDSSLAIAMEATGLLSASCVPSCWLSSYTIQKSQGQYIGYVMQKTIDLMDGKEFNSERLIKDEPTIDSSFYPLIRQAAETKSQTVTVKDTRPLWNQRIKIGIISTLKQLADNELGYFSMLPAVVNKQGDKAVFVYDLRGGTYVSWVICARKVLGTWVIVNRSRLVIS